MCVRRTLVLGHVVEDGCDEVEVVGGDGLVQRSHPGAALAVDRKLEPIV